MFKTIPGEETEVVPDLFEVKENSLEGYRFVIKIPVQFSDIDGMGHMNNVSYFAVLETARIEYFVRLMNLEESAREVTSMPFILGGQSIIYRSPALFRDRLSIGIRTTWIRRSSFGFDYKMVDEASGRLIAEGDGTYVMYNYQTSRSMPVPDDWIARMEEFEGRHLRTGVSGVQ